MAQPGHLFFLLIGLSCASYHVQVGAEVADHATEYIQKMADQLTDSMDLLAEETQKAKDGVHAAYEEVDAKAKEHTLDEVQKALEEMSARQCHPKHKRALRSLPDDVYDKLSDCLDFAQTVTNFQQIILGITNSLGDADEIVCSALRNIGFCVDGNSTVAEIGCVTGSVIDTAKEIKDKTIDVYESIKSITSAAKEIGKTFEECFKSSKVQLETKIKNVFEEHC
ncbi:hypothetical protein AAG570_005744 [Ranatra chinensis]|uniref:Uncharacterized protein n=1 Tax=Ranatra chinensis TaxID=642074 RepID=A0ABD0YK31_9HEMI